MAMIGDCGCGCGCGAVLVHAVGRMPGGAPGFPIKGSRSYSPAYPVNTTDRAGFRNFVLDTWDVDAIPTFPDEVKGDKFGQKRFLKSVTTWATKDYRTTPPTAGAFVRITCEKDRAVPFVNDAGVVVMRESDFWSHIKMESQSGTFYEMTMHADGTRTITGAIANWYSASGVSWADLSAADSAVSGGGTGSAACTLSESGFTYSMNAAPVGGDAIVQSVTVALTLPGTLADLQGELQSLLDMVNLNDLAATPVFEGVARPIGFGNVYTLAWWVGTSGRFAKFEGADTMASGPLEVNRYSTVGGSGYYYRDLWVSKVRVDEPTEACLNFREWQNGAAATLTTGSVAPDWSGAETSAVAHWIPTVYTYRAVVDYSTLMGSGFGVCRIARFCDGDCYFFAPAYTGDPIGLSGCDCGGSAIP